MDGALNLTNMKMRMLNGQQANNAQNQQYLQSLSNSLEHNQDPRQGGNGKGANPNNAQTRRLMETSNMFSVYRNSLKNNPNNNSNGFE